MNSRCGLLRRPTRFLPGLLVALVVIALPVDHTAADDKGCECVGRVGNVDCDYRDEVTLADLNRLIDHLFISLSPVPNPQEANCDNDPVCRITMGDLTSLIDYLFISYNPLPWCPRPLNHPPVSFIRTGASTVFIEAESAASSASPVDLRWEANDDLDHPYVPVEVACRWRVYGPYDSVTYQQIRDSFMVRVFVRPDGTLYRCGNTPPATFVVCDTSYQGGQQIVDCDTVLVDSVSTSSTLGQLDTILDVDCTAFDANPEYNRVVDSSESGSSPWTFETLHMLYDIFANHPSDSTVQRKVVFWLQARDPDEPAILEPTPEYLTLEVIYARHERPVAVCDFTKSVRLNQPTYASRRSYWDTTLTSWVAVRPDLPDSFAVARDYIAMNAVPEDGLLLRLLKYRTLVLVDDEVESSLWGYQTASPLKVSQVNRAINEGGTNASLWMRVPLGMIAGTAVFDTLFTTPAYAETWGVTSVIYSAWLPKARSTGVRLEDFVGADASRPEWPNLTIDSSRLHSLYYWVDLLHTQWDAGLAALPEVDYMTVTPQTEVLYTYHTLYQDGHPLGQDYDFGGLPVMVRRQSGGSRTVHTLFTPQAFEPETAQQMLNKVLDWLTEQPSAR